MSGARVIPQRRFQKELRKIYNDDRSSIWAEGYTYSVVRNRRGNYDEEVGKGEGYVRYDVVAKNRFPHFEEFVIATYESKVEADRVRWECFYASSPTRGFTYQCPEWCVQPPYRPAPDF